MPIDMTYMHIPIYELYTHCFPDTIFIPAGSDAKQKKYVVFFNKKTLKKKPSSKKKFFYGFLLLFSI